MSVINKMLRDLDQRQDAEVPGATTGVAPATSALRHGTASVWFGKPAAQNDSTGRPGLWLGVGALVVATVSAGAWLWWQNQERATHADVVATPTGTAPVTASVAAVAVSTVSAASTPAGIPAREPDASTSASAPGAATDMTLRMESSLSASKALDALLSTPAPVAATLVAPAPAPAPAALATPVAERPKIRTAATPAVTAPTPASDNNTAPTIQRQQQA